MYTSAFGRTFLIIFRRQNPSPLNPANPVVINALHTVIRIPKERPLDVRIVLLQCTTVRRIKIRCIIRWYYAFVIFLYIICACGFRSLSRDLFTTLGAQNPALTEIPRNAVFYRNETTRLRLIPTFKLYAHCYGSRIVVSIRLFTTCKANSKEYGKPGTRPGRGAWYEALQNETWVDIFERFLPQKFTFYERKIAYPLRISPILVCTYFSALKRIEFRFLIIGLENK